MEIQIPNEYYQSLQDSSDRGTWSRGVELSRSANFYLENKSHQETVIRVVSSGRMTSPRVRLWLDEEDWQCNCSETDDPCSHVIAATLAARSGKVQTAPTPSAPDASMWRLEYRLKRFPKGLMLMRSLSDGRERATVERLNQIDPGLSERKTLILNPEDWEIDRELSANRATPDWGLWQRLFTIFSRPEFQENHPSTFLEDLPIRFGPKAVGIEAELLSEGKGYRLRAYQDPRLREVFPNGVALVGEEIRVIAPNQLNSQERALLNDPGTYFSIWQTPDLISRLLPDLEKKIPVHRRTTEIPQIEKLPPRVVLHLDAQEDSLTVIASIVYGHPPIARVRGSDLEPLTSKSIPIRDQLMERTLARRLHLDLNLNPGQPIVFHGQEAFEFRKRIKDWETHGSGNEVFEDIGVLRPQIEIRQGRVQVQFLGKQERKTNLSWDQVHQAWDQGQKYFPVAGGGWAELPLEWLECYSDSLGELIRAQDEFGDIPKALQPEAARVIEELGLTPPSTWTEFRRKIESAEPEKVSLRLPSDLRVPLRHYQEDGVRWLQQLQHLQMGALLADDMGLGKTLQTLCALEGKTLVIAPTSVIPSWIEQTQRFRPGLRIHAYHGSNRVWPRDFDVVVTSHALLRLESERFLSFEWDTLVMDEAQAIRNPSSQLARVAHDLKAKFRVALSGTPIENRMEDLWSILHFANPGLLGTLENFKERYVRGFLRGQTQVVVDLHRRVKPFLLRRIKDEVAPELPPKTEVVLYCELSEEEKRTYTQLLLGTRSEVLRRLEQGQSLFSVLELLLRLRQASCHLGLLPGHEGDSASSKTQLLIESLKQSKENKHRALVFSQWTSFLDLLEPELTKADLRFNRLDGTTRDRGRVVQEFQDPNGPDLMLISLKAGGVGLNLTAADHIYIMDPWWNPAVEEQAADRAHRIGQEKPVLVHRLVSRDTIEERVLGLQAEKRQIADALIGDPRAVAPITKDELLALLQ